MLDFGDLVCRPEGNDLKKENNGSLNLNNINASCYDVGLTLETSAIPNSLRRVTLIINRVFHNKTVHTSSGFLSGDPSCRYSCSARSQLKVA